MARLKTGLEARVRTCASPGTIALTFDDGPDPIWTARVLAELGRLRATATFFVDARRALTHPELIEAMTAAGHEVGFHCVEHVRHSELSDAEVESEVERGLAMLDSMGIRPTAWRTPWGVVTAATRWVASAHGLELWDWSFDSHDWRGDSREEMLAALGCDGGLADGAVVLMHDALGPGARRGGCAETVRLTVSLLEAARGAGLRPAPLSAPLARVPA
jgi:peptidoglycan/xylan/chitin deacetylase (PgdA/CDA1 family)